MSFSEYIATVRQALESLPPPDVIVLGQDRNRLNNEILDQVKAIIGPAGCDVPLFRSFLNFDPMEYEESLRNRLRDGLPWAVWKSLGICSLLRIAIEHYFQRGPLTCDVDKWSRLGELMMESIYSAPWPPNAFQIPPDCSICMDPLYRPVKAFCGHEFHMHCLVRWVENSNSCPLCRARF